MLLQRGWRADRELPQAALVEPDNEAPGIVKVAKAGVAPSYYIEGLLYNVPNEKLTSSYQNCVVNTLNWYQQEARKVELLCANEQYYLLRDGFHTSWPQTNCDAFIESAVRLWNEW